MKCSIIYNILESYMVVQRQLLWLAKIVPKDWEVIFVDDGSEPPIVIDGKAAVILDTADDTKLPFKFTLLCTHDKRPWTQGAARNMGARHAKGEYMFMLDIDHIVSREAIEAIKEFNGTKMVFRRIKAVLDEQGNLCQDKEVLKDYGCPDAHLEGDSGAGWNIFAMRRDLFWKTGGYVEVSAYGVEDVDFAKRFGKMLRENKLPRHTVGPPIYLYPAPREDKKQIFHSLRRRKK